MCLQYNWPRRLKEYISVVLLQAYDIETEQKRNGGVSVQMLDTVGGGKPFGKKRTGPLAVKTV